MSRMSFASAGNREAGGRGSAQAWLDAAYDVLVESGMDAIRIVPLAKRLKLSRTSFYWFFKDRDALLAALLERWRAQNTQNLVSQCEAYAESITEAIFNVFDCWLDATLFDSGLEFAVRSWAQQSPRVAAAIGAADATRIAALTELFIRFGFAPHAANVRARTIYLTQIGYISMKTQEDLATRMARIPDYVHIFTGHAAQPNEIERFQARHHFDPRTMASATPRRRRKRTTPA
jgi:AcrR family transcriptional regulator